MLVRSPLARTPPGHDPRRGLERLRSRTTCYVVHQSGSGIVARALRSGRSGTPAEVVDRTAIAYYTGRRVSSHYYLGLDGRIWYLTHEAVRAPHVGVTEAERAAYLSGAWARRERPQSLRGRALSETAIAAWRAAWPRYASPQHLFEGRSVNGCSIASEMAPAGSHVDGEWIPLPGVVPWIGTRHTLAQHLAVSALAVDLAARYRWPEGWQHDPRGGPRSPRLLGHEDVDLYGRASSSGGWDPGALRADPRFDWPLVHGAIAALLAGGALAQFIRRALGHPAPLVG